MWCVRSGYADGREHAPATSFKVCASIKLTPVCAVRDDNRRKTRSWHGQHTASGTRAVVRSLVEHNSIHETMFGRFCLAYAISNQTINNVKVSYEIGMCYFILVLCAHKHECVRWFTLFPLQIKWVWAWMRADCRRFVDVLRWNIIMKCMTKTKHWTAFTIRVLLLLFRPEFTALNCILSHANKHLSNERIN